MIEDILIPAFWYTSTQLIQLIVPVVVIYLTLNLFAGLVFGRD